MPLLSADRRLPIKQIANNCMARATVAKANVRNLKMSSIGLLCNHSFEKIKTVRVKECVDTGYLTTDIMYTVQQIFNALLLNWVSIEGDRMFSMDFAKL